jgi:glutamate-5-semialdehyde dehydrogenase
MTTHDDVIELCKAARAAARTVSTAPTEVKNRWLGLAAAELRANRELLLKANLDDVRSGRARALSPAMLDRLTLTAERIEAMAVGLDEVAKLPDPVGETMSRWSRPNGLEITQIRIPLGVVGIIYESRPNVTADAPDPRHHRVVNDSGDPTLRRRLPRLRRRARRPGDGRAHRSQR